MFDLFYIVESSPSWYTLRIKETHYCVSCSSSLETVFNTLRKYIKKYKTKEKFFKALSQLSDHGKLNNDHSLAYFKSIYDEKGRLFEDQIEEIVSETLKEIKGDSQFNRIKGKLKKVEVVEEKTILVPVKTTVENNKVIKKPLIRKPMLLNIK